MPNVIPVLALIHSCPIPLPNKRTILQLVCSGSLKLCALSQEASHASATDFVQALADTADIALEAGPFQSDFQKS